MAKIKTAVLAYHNTSMEVSSMDDELPLIIFVVSNLDNEVGVYSKLNFVKDYIDKKIDLDFEEQVLSNVEVAVNYIANDWKLEPKS